jgi:hypothetical protein
MKLQRIVFVLVLAVLFISTGVHSRAGKSEKSPLSPSTESVEAFSGRWVQNSQTVIDNKEIPGITGGALDSHEELRGPLYLQGSEKERVAHRSIVITPAQK